MLNLWFSTWDEDATTSVQSPLVYEPFEEGQPADSGTLETERLEKQAERKTLHRFDADAEMYALLKDFCRFSPATDPHEIAALQSKALMLLEEMEEKQ